MKKISLKSILEGEEQQSNKFSNDAKRNFLEIVSTYNKYQEMMDRKSDITKVAETLGAITDAAQQLAINEEDEWFDKHTVKRNMGDLKKLVAQFDKVARESATLDQRMTGLYEDMGHILSRYYKIGEITEDEMKSRLGMTNEGEIKEAKKECSCKNKKSINEESESDFIVFWKNKQHKIKGTSLYDAKKKAIVQLKVPKSKQATLNIVSQKSQDAGDFRFN